MAGEIIDYSSPQRRLENLKAARNRLKEYRKNTFERLDAQERDADEQIAELEKLVREGDEQP